jgi:pectate disaccharide-lyase
MVLATVTAFGARHRPTPTPTPTPTSPLAITSPSTLPSGVVSTFYSTYLTATGGTAPYNWTWITCSGACNTGLGFDATVSNNSTDGHLEGTPVNAGTSIFGFRVTDATGATATANLGITILSPTTTPPTTPPPTTPTPLAITSSGALPSGVASTSYNTSLTATGGTTPYNWAIQSCSGVCNAGLSLSPAGVFSGTPINSGTSTYTVGVIDATGQSASASLNLTIAAATPSSTANYFVSPSGSDSNPCTQSSPCATPDYVVNNKAAAGDTVQVAAGTYDFGGSEVHFTKSGTAGNPITLTCATRGACKIQNSVTGNSTVIWIQGSYIVFDGFEVTNTSSAGNNLGFYITGSNVSVTRNTVHHIEAACDSMGGAGIDVGTGAGSGSVIDSNLVYDIGWTNTSVCSGKNTTHGIDFETNGGATGTITNNIVYHVLGGWGIQFQGASVGTTGSVIANNLLFSNGNGGIVFNEVGGTLDYNTVANNIILVNGTNQSKCGIYEFVVSGTHNVYTNNDASGNGGGDYCFSTGSQTAGISVDPASGTTFANWKADGSGDYHQKAGSPTINNGSSSKGVPPKDMDGNQRPQGAAYDIGAYESPN